MAKAYRCDLCQIFTDYAHKVDGLDFKIGEYRDEFTGTHDRKQEVHEVCPDCYNKIMACIWTAGKMIAYICSRVPENRMER